MTRVKKKSSIFIIYFILFSKIKFGSLRTYLQPLKKGESSRREVKCWVSFICMYSLKFLNFRCDNGNMSILSLAPWCNTVGIILTLLRLQKNQMIVYLNKFQEELYLECIQKYKVFLFFLVLNLD